MPRGSLSRTIRLSLPRPAHRQVGSRPLSCRAGGDRGALRRVGDHGAGGDPRRRPRGAGVHPRMGHRWTPQCDPTANDRPKYSRQSTRPRRSAHGIPSPVHHVLHQASQVRRDEWRGAVVCQSALIGSSAIAGHLDSHPIACPD